MIQLGAGSLSALCLAFSWRAFQRCRAITSAATAKASSDNPDVDSVEQSLLEREWNVELNLAKRNVRSLAQAAFTGGLGLFFLALAGGQGHHLEALQALALGGIGGVACLGLHRRVGSLAESWREAINRRRRRQGVDQPERTG